MNTEPAFKYDAVTMREVLEWADQHVVWTSRNVTAPCGFTASTSHGCKKGTFHGDTIYDALFNAWKDANK